MDIQGRMVETKAEDDRENSLSPEQLAEAGSLLRRVAWPYASCYDTRHPTHHFPPLEPTEWVPVRDIMLYTALPCCF